MSIYENYKKVRENINSIALSCGRKGEDISIISVSKTFPADAIQEAIDSGIKVFGENRIQEAKEKIPVLHGDFSFHMIGHLQSNKAKLAVALFDCIHSIDKMETAEKVNREAGKADKIQEILIQVNVSGETTKSGITSENLYKLTEGIMDLKNLRLLGLMTMAPFTDNKEPIRGCFRKTRELMHELNKKFGLKLKELSMGMSSDYEIAVTEGATMVRIGSAIFGSRG